MNKTCSKCVCSVTFTVGKSVRHVTNFTRTNISYGLFVCPSQCHLFQQNSPSFSNGENMPLACLFFLAQQPGKLIGKLLIYRFFLGYSTNTFSTIFFFFTVVSFGLQKWYLCVRICTFLRPYLCFIQVW